MSSDSQKSKSKTWVEIKKSALVRNIKIFRQLIGEKTKLMAVVKSNAYGHGLVHVAKIALENGAEWLGVDSIDEALTLRKIGIQEPIMVLGYTLNSRLEEAINNVIRIVVYNPETIKKLAELLAMDDKRLINVHIKVETGTGRQGVMEDKIESFVRLIKKYPKIKIEGIYTHYANIEDTTDHSYAQKQLETFKRIAKKAEAVLGDKIPIKHTACSAAAILFPETYFDMARLGISMYGLWPSRETLVSAKETGRNQIDLKPALTWKTIVAQIKELPPSSYVSYGCTEKLMTKTKVAVLPIGYWDGFDRKLSNVANVLINGTRCKILGRVCMNMIMVDVSRLKNIKPENEAVLLGAQGDEQITA